MYQKLITKPIEKRIDKVPLYYHEKNNLDVCYAKVIVKFFGGGVYSWWAIEGERLENGDIQFYGLVQGNDGKEWGYFRLHELEEIKFPPFNLGVERDMHFEETINKVLFH